MDISDGVFPNTYWVFSNLQYLSIALFFLIRFVYQIWLSRCSSYFDVNQYFSCKTAGIIMCLQQQNFKRPITIAVTDELNDIVMLANLQRSTTGMLYFISISQN